MSSVKQKLNVKRIGEICQALRDLEIGPQRKMSVNTLFVLINAGQIIAGLIFAGLMFANFL